MTGDRYLPRRAVGAAATAERLHAEVDEARRHGDRREAHRGGPPPLASSRGGDHGGRGQRQAGTVGGAREPRHRAVQCGRRRLRDRRLERHVEPLGVLQPAGGSGRRRRRVVGGSGHGRVIL
jgi:hypothetical protein